MELDQGQGRWVPAERTLDRGVTSRQWESTSDEEVLAAKGVGGRQWHAFPIRQSCVPTQELSPTLAVTTTFVWAHLARYASVAKISAVTIQIVPTRRTEWLNNTRAYAPAMHQHVPVAAHSTPKTQL